MLVHVSVKDIALIDAVELSLSPGLTVLTGETGAGKSILVEALLLLLGGRASADQVRSGCAEGAVQAQFECKGADAKEISRILADSGLPPLEDGALVLRRAISREGRHKQFINGALATVAQLKLVAEPLVDFTGQHAHQALLRPGAQEVLVDAFGGHQALLDEMAAAWGLCRGYVRELRELREKNSEKDRRLDVIRFYIDEIDALAPALDEDVRLAQEHSRLKNAATLRQSLGEARDLLVDGSDDALTRLQRALAALQRAARDDASVAPLQRTLEEAVALVDDVGRSLNRIGEVEADPERLEKVEERLDALKKLMKKHGGDLAGVLRARDELALERDSLDGASERIDELEQLVLSSTAAATSVADKLTAKRKAAGKKLAAAVQVELSSLGMPAASVAVAVERAELGPRGVDHVDVSFSANKGEQPASLAKVASGGELSRVLLAVKRALLVNDPVPVSIFDEVDAGVGGAIGEAIGEKLQAIAEGRQVLCISHLPQIAAKADQHLVVEKALDAGRTVSRVRLLGHGARTEELARMLGGKVITAATRKHAEEMLERGRAHARAPAVAPRVSKKKSA